MAQYICLQPNSTSQVCFAFIPSSQQQLATPITTGSFLSNLGSDISSGFSQVASFANQVNSPVNILTNLLSSTGQNGNAAALGIESASTIQDIQDAIEIIQTGVDAASIA